MKRPLRRFAIAAAATLLVLVCTAAAFVHSMQLDRLPQANRQATAADLPFLQRQPPPPRGRILAVVSSAATFPDGKKKAGYELTELSRAYWVFVANGYTVDIASPQGGEPPMRLDDDDVTDADFAFLNDAEAMRKLTQSHRLDAVDPHDYRAVYFVGGKGTMFDFPDNPHIARIVHGIDGNGGVVGAVCHGPAAFMHLRREDGTPWLRNRRVTGFSNAEELLLIEDARSRFPYLLEDGLQAQGALYTQAPMYLAHVVVDGRMITGQNPWSTWAVAEGMVRLLGHAPAPRQPTPEEISVRLLARYHADGLEAASAMIDPAMPADRRLVLMHAMIAAMQWRLGDAWRLHRLAAAIAAASPK